VPAPRRRVGGRHLVHRPRRAGLVQCPRRGALCRQRRHSETVQEAGAAPPPRQEPQRGVRGGLQARRRGLPLPFGPESPPRVRRRAPTEDQGGERDVLDRMLHLQAPSSVPEKVYGS